MIETTTYKVKTYSPEFMEDEIKLTQEFQARHNLNELYLTFRHQTQIDNMKNYRDNGVPNFPFTPTDHWYLFDENDDLVGHVHSYPQPETKRCTMSVVVTKEGHEQGGQLLFETLVSSVKERGYETLVMNTSEDHPIELEFLSKFGFDKIRVRNLKAHVPISELIIEKNDKYNLLPFDAEKHREKVITELYLPLGYQKQQLDAQFDATKTAQENGTVPSWVVATEGENVVGQSIAFYGRPGIDYLAQFNTVTTNIESEESVPLINAVYGSHLGKLPESITHVEHFLFNQVLNLRPLYEKIGFKYIENHLYEKVI